MGDDAELYMDMQEPGFWDGLERYNDKYDDFDIYEEEIEYARYFFVDYENVNRDGLNGITKLSEKDCVRIYYSDAAETLTFGLHRRINSSRAYFDYIKVQMPIKNAVDCRILFDVQDIAKENRNAEFYIVSKDTDFDKAIEEFNVHNLKVKKVLQVCKCDKPVKKEQAKKTKSKSTTKKTSTQNENENREAQIRSFLGQHFKENEYIEHKEDIIQTVLNGKTRQQINTKLMKFYPSETVGKIYKKLQPLIKGLPGK